MSEATNKSKVIERPDDPRVLIPEEQVQVRVRELAKEIEDIYQDTELTMVCVLKGSFVFFSDLVRQVNLPVSCEFLEVSSYGKQMKSSGEAKLTLDLTAPITNKHVLIVEDIVDSGVTVQFLLQTLHARNPASIRICSLLVRPDPKTKHLPEIDFMGFQIENEFAVGYGLDYAERYRGLSYIGAMGRTL